MLDYEKDVKQHIIDKLAGDVFGKGRIESAIFHTFQHVYQKGVEDGKALVDNSTVTLCRMIVASDELEDNSPEMNQALEDIMSLAVDILNPLGM